MTDLHYIPLDDRGVLTIAGPDRAEFLQGLVTNDVARVGPARAAWGALLSPQGKFRHDFFMIEDAAADGGSRYLFDCEGGERLMDLGVTLRRYVLRSKVTLDMARDLAVLIAWGDGVAEALGLPGETGAAAPFAGGYVFVDPRDAGVGVRVLAPRAEAIAALEAAGLRLGDRADWDRRRIPLGLPDGSRDMEVDKAILLENGFDELGGVDWKKGCYMGQELTARTKYRGLVKKRLTPVRVVDGAEGDLSPNTPVTAEGKEVGTLFSTAGDVGLALLRLKALGKPLQAGGLSLAPTPPAWLKLTETAPADGNG